MVTRVSSMVLCQIIFSSKVHQVRTFSFSIFFREKLTMNVRKLNYGFMVTVFTLSDFITRQMAWVWLLWLLSQTWITIHIWTPKAERLASTEKLFVIPMYNGLLIDQSMALNRKRDDQKDVKTEVRCIILIKYFCCSDNCDLEFSIKRNS